MRVFEWDPLKAASNLRKHGVAFEDAVLVFDDPLAQFEPDRIVDGELRWRATGFGREFTLAVVAYTTWDDEQGTEIIRIISARRAEKHERRHYQAGKDR
ncbi:MAG: BrnT family toxin [Devosia nanyangense]|uniref:BrnT family toxin n=1 Tax=Devosia nanyangense TaxID=1228055 RepID=A0A933L1M2_9HYPH|nr:BrnT family toxin [Devosia nanyangense]